MKVPKPWAKPPAHPPHHIHPTTPVQELRVSTPVQELRVSESESIGQASDAAIVLCDVRKSYGSKAAVDNVSLSVDRGEFFGVLGPNGAGKTTLIEIIEGLRTADDGLVTVLGRDPSKRDIALLPRLGVQTQRAAFFTRLTAREHLRTMAALYGVSAASAADALELVGICDQADVRVDKLSGGQRQRLAIASALVHRPEVVFLDEATASLDPQARRELWKVLGDLKGAGSTIIYTTHHLDEAEALCDRVAIMANGRFVALDTPHNLIGRSQAPTRILVPVGQIDPGHFASHHAVDRVSVSGGSVVLETRHSADVLTEVGRLCGLDGVQTRTASLEDVYLELVREQVQA
jgi:ABC-2 type transport system ATP-binding protein